MLPEQTLNNMSIEELVSYSETCSQTPARVAQLIAEKAIEVIREGVESDLWWESEAGDRETEIDDLRSRLNQIENIAQGY